MNCAVPLESVGALQLAGEDMEDKFPANSVEFIFQHGISARSPTPGRAAGSRAHTAGGKELEWAERTLFGYQELCSAASGHGGADAEGLVVASPSPSSDF